MTCIYRHQQDLPQGQRVVMAIGNFDGIHLGHRVLITETVRLAREHNAEAWVMTFEPHAAEFFNSHAAPRLYSLREKCLELFTLGIQAVWCQPFNAAIAAYSPQFFLENIVCHPLDVKQVVVGEDFRFGHKRSGDVHTLIQYGKKLGFGVNALPAISLNGQRISSSQIRIALQNADFSLAESLLGKPYTISGRVQHGDHLGRELGFPTANLKWSKPSSPLHGIYVVSASGLHVNDKLWHPAAASLGTRPSVSGTDFRCEVHLLDQDCNLYGRQLSVRFHKKLHDEHRYANLQQLQQAIANDINQTRVYFKAEGFLHG